MRALISLGYLARPSYAVMPAAEIIDQTGIRLSDGVAGVLPQDRIARAPEKGGAQ